MIEKYKNKIYTFRELSELSGLTSNAISVRVRNENIDTWRKGGLIRGHTKEFRLTMEEFRVITLPMTEYKKHKMHIGKRLNEPLVQAKIHQDEILNGLPENTKGKTKSWLQILSFTGEIKAKGKQRKGCMSQ